MDLIVVLFQKPATPAAKKAASSSDDTDSDDDKAKKTPAKTPVQVVHSQNVENKETFRTAHRRK